MVKRSLLILVAALMLGCVKERVVIQTVEVPIVSSLPNEIKAYQFPNKPKFTTPEESIVGLDKENLETLKQMIFSLYSRVCELHTYHDLSCN